MYSDYPQFFGIAVTGTVKNDSAMFAINHSDSAAMSHLRINIINKDTGNIVGT